MSGEPSYLELGVTDADKARAFYGALFGWQASGSAGPGQVSTPTLDICILHGDSESHFEVFFTVDDLEQSLGKLAELGGRTVSEVNTSAGFGRWVECADDHGVRFGLRQPE